MCQHLEPNTVEKSGNACEIPLMGLVMLSEALELIVQNHVWR